MDTIDILMPKTEKICVLGKTRTLRPLTLRQTVELGRLLSDLHEELKAHFTGNTPDALLIIKIIEAAGGRRAGEILGILLGAELSDEEIGQAGQIPVLELSELAAALGRVNDFRRISENFRTALGTTRK
ncbi:MAG: hypothetical protein PHW69_02640 [Elusimicrobiaceae bacterium]|nr:hypothetical protein [Elusimicrobiaceae bacterium]